MCSNLTDVYFEGEHVPKTLEEIEKTLALLAFDKPEESPFGYLMQLSHRHQVNIIHILYWVKRNTKGGSIVPRKR
jgi:hypothetical protein